jgi:ferredoxin
MKIMKRDIIKINQEKCTGCGDCIPGCPEGALQVIDGKAHLISDLFCDGLGACIGTCPQGAIEVESREAEPYDEYQVMENVVKRGAQCYKGPLETIGCDHGEKELLNQALDFLNKRKLDVPEYQEEKTFVCGCPGSMEVDLGARPESEDQAVVLSAELRNWPVQLQLLNPQAPYLKNADLLISADCAPLCLCQLSPALLKR